MSSDEEIDSKRHSRLIDDIIQLDKKQYVKNPSRTESAIQVSEFNLVKPELVSEVNVGDLTKVLQTRSKHVDISKKVQKAQTSGKTLNAPLEKPQAERIKRSVGFERVQTELGKWDSIVTKNRVASHLKFPVKEESVDFVEDKKIPFNLRRKSEIEIELDKIEGLNEPENEVETFSLSMAEMVERRKEIARLRAHQSYKERKQFQQNKIKSKKFHRIEKRIKLKEALKEFELLKKTDPDAALQKLEQLEKARAEERMSLRHRSTGTWAKNKVVKAKYNKECRQALAQQLSVSRELTQKMKMDDSSDSEGDEPKVPIKKDDSNPWVQAQGSEVENFVSDYRKFWSEQKNSQSELQKELEENVKLIEEEIRRDSMGGKLTEDDEDEIEEIDLTLPSTEPTVTKNSCKKQKSKRNKKRKQKQTDDNNIKVPESNKKQKVLKTETHCSGKWKVEEIDNRFASNQPIEDVFDDLKDISRKTVNKKLETFKKELKEMKKSDKKPKPKQSKPHTDMSLPREKMRPDIDEELGFEEDKTVVKKHKIAVTNGTTDLKENTDIDPNKFMNVKPVNLHTKLPDNVVFDDNDEGDEDTQRAYVTEAFEDDDVVADFRKEKKETIDKQTPKDIDLNLPGWGTWGGKGIKKSKRRKRFIIRFPKKLPRNDDNKGNLIVSEQRDQAMREHQVTEVPFPFTSVKDFEASIRAPIGDTFVPQTAFKRLIEPAVVTKAGAIIEPMSKDQLVNLKLHNLKKKMKRVKE